MKTLLIISLFLIGCSSVPEQPTPFTTGKEVQTSPGCRSLTLEVEAYNRAHPSAPAKKADC